MFLFFVFHTDSRLGDIEKFNNNQFSSFLHSKQAQRLSQEVLERQKLISHPSSCSLIAIHSLISSQSILNGKNKIFLLMLPQQRAIPLQNNVTSPTTIRTTINHPISKNAYTSALPISPQNIQISPVKSPNNKIIPQSHSTIALTTIKNLDPITEPPQSSSNYRQEGKDVKFGEIFSAKLKPQGQNFQKLKSFLNKNKETAIQNESPSKDVNPDTKEKPKGQQFFMYQQKNKMKTIKNVSNKKPSFSPSKLKMNLLNFKQSSAEINDSMATKKSPRAYLRMTLDARLEPKDSFNMLDNFNDEKSKTTNLGKAKSPRASHKPERPSIQGSFWKNKSPTKIKNSFPLEHSFTFVKKSPQKRNQLSKTFKDHFQNKQKFREQQKNPEKTEMMIPPLNLKTTESSSTKGNFIPYRKSLKNYKIWKKIGSGVFSDNYLAVDNKSGWIFCLKTIRKGSVLNAPGEAVQNFIKQYKAHFIIDDPNIISIYDIFCDDEFIYILSELMTDGTLKDYLCEQKKKKVQRSQIRHENESGFSKTKDNSVDGLENADERKDIQLIEKISGINSALETIHSSYKIPHGNINPSSVFISFDVCKISKFIIHEDKNFRKTALNYTPPEVLVGRPITCKADMWCLGLLIFEMAAERSLFDSDSMEQNKLAHHILLLKIDAQLEKIKIISKPLKQMIRSLLKINPEERISSTVLLTSSLLEIYEPEKPPSSIKDASSPSMPHLLKNNSTKTNNFLQQKGFCERKTRETREEGGMKQFF